MKTNIPKAFAEYMEGLGLGTFSEDIFIGGAPLGGPDRCWWILSGGGNTQSRNNTGERMKLYTLNVYFRDIDGENVVDEMQEFEELINSAHCTQLAGYDTVEMEAVNFQADEDLDNEDRTIGLIQVGLTLYQS